MARTHYWSARKAAGCLRISRGGQPAARRAAGGRVRRASEGRPHVPLAGFIVEERERDIVVHAGADVGRCDLYVESAAESLRRRRVASLLLEELDRHRVAD